MHKAIQLFLLALMGTLSYSYSYAQVTTVARIELEPEPGYRYDNCANFGESGFLLQFLQKQPKDGGRERKVNFYDQDLNLVGSKSILLKKGINFNKNYVVEEGEYRFYKNWDGLFTHVFIDPANRDISTFSGKIPSAVYSKEMVVLGGKTILAATQKRKPHLFFLDHKSGDVKTIPIDLPEFKPQKLSFLNLQALPDAGKILVYLKAIEKAKDSDVYILIYNEKGVLEKKFNFSAGMEQNITSISATDIALDTYVFAGTYSTRTTSTSEGIFLAEVKNSRRKFIQFYSYLDLKDFLDYLPERRQEKIEKKKEKMEAKGKELRYNYNISDHNIILAEDGYLLLGEAFYPTYRTVSSYSNGQWSYQQVFDGYQYTHGILAKFSWEGALDWDMCFEMWPAYKPYQVIRFISLLEGENGEVKLAYASRSKIYSKRISPSGHKLEDYESDEIASGKAGDKIKWTRSYMQHWYDNYFITSGYQVIKNKENEKVDNKRKVYFVNKIQY